MAKWMTAVQTDNQAVDCIVNSVVAEYLAVNHQYAPCLLHRLRWPQRLLTVLRCSGLLGDSGAVVRWCMHCVAALIWLCRTFGSGPTGSNLYIETDQAHGTQLNWFTDPHSTNDWGAGEVTFSSTYSLGPNAIVSTAPSAIRSVDQDMRLVFIPSMTALVHLCRSGRWSW